MRSPREAGGFDGPASHLVRSQMIFVAFLRRIERPADRLARSRCRFCGLILGERPDLMRGLSRVVHWVPLADIRLRS